MQEILRNPKYNLKIFTNAFKTNNIRADGIINQCFEPAFDEDAQNRTFDDLLTYINKINITGGSRKKKRTLKKGGRPKRKQTKTRK